MATGGGGGGLGVAIPVYKLTRAEGSGWAYSMGL